MTIRNVYAAEAWDKVYNAFTQINFTSYDYDTVKESLLQYLKIYHAEHFNDFIESSELIAMLELFAYVAELMAYRVDIMTHENFMTTAQRKQSILKLARLISYRASRNIPARGLVKLTAIRTSEDVYDSLGNNLNSVTITWNDATNTNWKEQFFLVMNRVLTTKFGQPSKAQQVGDVAMQLYTLKNTLGSFRNGVYTFNAIGQAEQVAMEAVPADLDENGPFERAPDLSAQFNIIYSSDGKGDGSDYTGFLMMVKQGTLYRTDYTIQEPVANRRLELDAININDTDIWIYRVDDTGKITEKWTRVETLNEQNIYFNNVTGSKKKYEVETLENDRVALLFGDGNFSDAPVGSFQLWTRVSVNGTVTIPKSRISNEPMGFSYITPSNNTFTCDLTFSLTAAIQNNAPSETIEHIRQSAPSTYYAQNRMVNGQDYNTFPLKDPTILRLKTVNRTFAGQPKYIEWNDASRTYENTKLFGDDLVMFQDVSADMVETTASAKTIVDTYIEPLLWTTPLLNTLVHVLASSDSAYGIVTYPRRKFIEDNRPIYFDIDGNPVNPYGKQLDGHPLHTTTGALNEKTMIQGALDQHWYGEPSSLVQIGGTWHGVVSDPLVDPKDDGNLYLPDLPRTVDGVNTYPPGDTGSGVQNFMQPQTYFGLRFNPLLSAFGNGDIELLDVNDSNAAQLWGYGDAPRAPCVGLDYYQDRVEVITIEMTSDQTTFTVISNLRGKLPNYSINLAARWSEQNSETLPFDFAITGGSTAFAPGDAFIVDFFYEAGSWGSTVRRFGALDAVKVNLTGWWELIPSDVITATESLGGAGIFASGPDAGPNLVQQLNFDPSNPATSWVFLVAAKINSLGEIDRFSIYNRNIKTVVESPTTNFWFNQDTQIIDSQTKKPVFDKIRILRSNLDERGVPLKKADIYDVVNQVYDADGVLVPSQLEVLPTDTINWTQAGDSTPDNVLQFETFSVGAYEFFVIDVADETNPIIVKWLACNEYSFKSGYDNTPYDVNAYDEGMTYVPGYGYFRFDAGNLISGNTEDNYRLGRRRKVPAPAVNDPLTGEYSCNADVGLDFMWQHFSPITNLIDPSVTNIHDAFVLTSGYHTSMRNYVSGITEVEPQPPTPFELRNTYGYLLKNKMLSDTVVLHSGKIKLLFGALADQRLRAKFRVVKSPTATFSDERIKSEIVNVIDTYFDIQNWDFGDKFYATELIALIHQRLTTEISSVVLVPMYSVNSFGSLFTIDSGFDEVLQSAATVDDVEIVDALTPTVLRQIR